jgi:hypothetical protein
MPDLTPLWQRMQLTRARAQDVRRRAQQARQHAAQAQRQAAISYQRAQIACPRRSMPGATGLTCAITAAILRQRGLLDKKTLTSTRALPGVPRAVPGPAFPSRAAQAGRP